MKVWIVRHGDAQQAEAICRVVMADNPRRLLSSPAAECVATLGPLARESGLSILEDAALGKPTSAGRIAELMNHLPDRTVLCTDGEAMSALLTALRPAGLTVIGDLAADDELTGSGVVWELDLWTLRLICRAPLRMVG